MSEPYLGHYFGPPPIRKTATMRVFTPHGTEEFEGNNFHVDEGYLIVYKAAMVDDQTIRLYPVAVFKPEGWFGYAPGEPDEVKPMPVGFHQQTSEPSK